MISFWADPPSRKQQNNRTECFRPSNKQTDGETNRQTDRPTDPVTGRLPDRQTPTLAHTHSLRTLTCYALSVTFLLYCCYYYRCCCCCCLGYYYCCCCCGFIIVMIIVLLSSHTHSLNSYRAADI